MMLQFPASFANRLDEALRQIETITKDKDEEIETLDKENQDLRRENEDLKRALREEIERKDSEIQGLRTEIELLKITGLNLQDFSPSQVSSCDSSLIFTLLQYYK